MKTGKKRSAHSPSCLRLWPWLLWLGLTAGGCVNDYLYSNDTRTGESVPITIRLVTRFGGESKGVPTRGCGEATGSMVTQQGIQATFSASTRGLSDEAESRVNNVYVFFLRTSDNRVYSVVKATNVTTAADKTFTANLEVAGNTGEEFRCLVLANAGSLLDGQNLKLYKDKTYTELQQMLAGGGYTATPVLAPGDFGMWGEAKETIRATHQPQKITVNMLRALARVDIGLGINADKWDGKDAAGVPIPFRLKKVFIFKPQSSYSFMPLAAAYNATTQQVTLPSPAGKAVGTPFEYAVPTGANSLTASIYLPEADVRKGANAEPGDAHHKNRCAIVVQGSYQSHPDTYYRIDFHDGKLITDLLRNHSYQMSITSVSGDGSTTAEIAYEQVKSPISVLPDYSVSGLVVDGFQAEKGTVNGISRNVRFNISLADPTNYKFTATCNFNKNSDAFITKGTANTTSTATSLQTSKSAPSSVEGVNGDNIWLNVFRTGPGDKDIKGTLTVKAVPKDPASGLQEAIYSVPITIKTSCKIGDSKMGTLLWADRNVGATPRGPGGAPVGLNYTNDTNSDDNANTGFKGSYITWDQAPAQCATFGATNNYTGKLATGWRLPTHDEQVVVAPRIYFSKQRAYIVSDDKTAGTVGCWFPLSGMDTSPTSDFSYSWSFTLYDSDLAYVLGVGTSYMGIGTALKRSYGLSVRCVRDN